MVSGRSRRLRAPRRCLDGSGVRRCPFARSPGGDLVTGFREASGHVPGCDWLVKPPDYRPSVPSSLGRVRHPMVGRHVHERSSSATRRLPTSAARRRAAFASPRAHAAHTRRLDVDDWCCAGIDELAAGAPTEPDVRSVRTCVRRTRVSAGNRVDYGDPRNSYLDDVLTRRWGSRSR